MQILPGEHPITGYWRWVEEIPAEVYPPELVAVGRRRIPGVAAFPGSHGLYAPCGFDPHSIPEFPHGGVMFVGNHLDSEESYTRRVEAGTPHGDPCPGAKRMPFWNRLYDLLDAAEVPREQLFATNAHPALLRGKSATGRIAARYPAWGEATGRILQAQIQVMRPRVIACLAAPASDFVQRMLGRPRTREPSWEPVSIRDLTTRLVSLAHPSAYEWQFDRDRRYAGVSGRAADALLLRDTWRGTTAAE